MFIPTFFSQNVNLLDVFSFLDLTKQNVNDKRRWAEGVETSKKHIVSLVGEKVEDGVNVIALVLKYSAIRDNPHKVEVSMNEVG